MTPRFMWLEGPIVQLQPRDLAPCGLEGVIGSKTSPQRQGEMQNQVLDPLLPTVLAAGRPLTAKRGPDDGDRHSSLR